MSTWEFGPQGCGHDTPPKAARPGAAAYGANEGGSFCGACALQWGAIGIGAGAGIGAGIGALAGAASPSHLPGAWPAGATPAPLPRRGLAVALRF
jgi:hypothetical protein